MNNLHFQLVTPEKTILSKELASLSCPTTMGQITILPNHSQLVATLAPGELHAKTATEEFFIHVSGGFVEVREGNNVIVLADSAEHHYEIDEQRANAAKERAQNALKQHVSNSTEYAKTLSALERSLSRINISRKHSKRKSAFVDQGTFNE
jgi:F-type H+-transporting ATPase subunit epsilon